MIKKIREFLRLIVIDLKKKYYVIFYGMHIDKSARISFGSKLDKTNPKGIYIGARSYVASGAIIFSHDFSRSKKCNTYIGSNCFVGCNAIVMPGVKIGDEVVIGSGAIVTKDIDSNSIVAGNPAKVLKTGVRTGAFGKIVEINNE